MNGRGRRAKGAAGEREACGLLQDQLGVAVKRRLGQSREGGHDTEVRLSDSSRLVLEVKRQERAAIQPWLEQAAASCSLLGDIPAVMWRPSRARWVVVMDAEDWCALVREAMDKSTGEQDELENLTR